MTSSAEQPHTDLSAVQTPADLAACLNALRIGRGLTYEAMGNAAQKLQPKSGRSWDALASSSLGDIVNGRYVPSKEKFETFLAVCRVSPAETAEWWAAWNRVRLARVVRPANAVRVREALPRRLGVSAAIEVEGSIDELPVYVARDFDQRLRAALADGMARGGFVLLAGGASVGKTRALYEGVRATIPDWWLVHPADTSAVRDLAQKSVQQTVVWLDELLRYLEAPDPLAASTVRTLLTAGLVVVSTIWQSDYNVRITSREQIDDPYAKDRDLLRLAAVFDVPDAFTGSELARTKQLAVGDRRLRVAIESTEAGVAQVLAAGPELVRWWELAPNPYSKAVITAAVDARRLGVTVPLTKRYLAEAAPGYMTSTERAVAPADWFEHALADATKKLCGAARAVEPVAGEGMRVVVGYTAADFLLQRARQTRRVECPPSSTWRALLEHCCHGPEDRERLGKAAELRMRWREAIAFYGGPVVDDDETSALKVAQLLAKDGRYAEAVALAETLTDRWRLGADFAAWLGKAGRAGELRSLAAGGDWNAASCLAGLLTAKGQLDEAIALIRPFSNDGNWFREGAFADLLVAGGDGDELRARAEAGSRPAIGRLSNLLAKQGQFGEAIEVLTPYVKSEPGVAERVVELLLQQDKLDDAVAVLKRFPYSGTAVNQIVDLLIDYGRRAEAVEFLRARAAEGNREARYRLPQYGPPEQLQDGVASGDRHALNLWVDVLIEDDRIDDAIEVFRSRMDTAESAGMWWLAADLIGLLCSYGRVDDLKLEVEAGTEGAADRLAELLDGRRRTGLPGPASKRRPRSTYRGWIVMPQH